MKEACQNDNRVFQVTFQTFLNISFLCCISKYNISLHTAMKIGFESTEFPRKQTFQFPRRCSLNALNVSNPNLWLGSAKYSKPISEICKVSWIEYRIEMLHRYFISVGFKALKTLCIKRDNVILWEKCFKSQRTVLIWDYWFPFPCSLQIWQWNSVSLGVNI